MGYLSVINTVKKAKPDYFVLYSNVFLNELKKATKKYTVPKEFDQGTLKN